MPATPEITGFAALMTVRGGAAQGQNNLQILSQDTSLSEGNKKLFGSVFAEQLGLSEGLSRQLRQWLAGASSPAASGTAAGMPGAASDAAGGSSLPLTELGLPPELLQAALAALRQAQAAADGQALPSTDADSEELLAFLQELAQAGDTPAPVTAPAQAVPGLSMSHLGAGTADGQVAPFQLAGIAAAASQPAAQGEAAKALARGDALAAGAEAARSEAGQTIAQNANLVSGRGSFTLMLQEQQLQQPVTETAVGNRAALDTLSAITPSSAHSTVATSSGAAQPAPTTQNAAPTPMGPPLPMSQPNWGSALVERVMWMSSQQLSRADIAVDPPELGPLQVRVNSQGEQASVVFTAQHAATRDALDQALPRLREMLNAQGIELVDVDVSDRQSDPGAEQQSAQSRGQRTLPGDNSGADSAAGGEIAIPLPSGLVDAYA